MDRDEKVTRGFHETGADVQGYAYCDQIDGTFSIIVQRFDFLPERMASRWHFKKIAKLYDAKERPLISLAWEPFPSGSGKVIGRVHDQHRPPLTQYYLNLTRATWAERLDWSDAEGIRDPVSPSRIARVGSRSAASPGDLHRDGPPLRLSNPCLVLRWAEVHHPRWAETPLARPRGGRGRGQGSPVWPGPVSGFLQRRSIRDVLDPRRFSWRYDQAQIVQNHGQTGRSFSWGRSPTDHFVLSSHARNVRT